MNTLQTITEFNPCFQCCFCKSGEIDDLRYGNLFMYDGVVVHYFCMLFSAALSQHGRDDDGILGFLPNDIMSEVRRSLRLRCTFCNNAGASVGCCNKKCRTAFHYPCGLKHGANYQFFGNYESYCVDHVVHKRISIPRKDWVCPICTAQVCDRSEAIQSSCCGSAVFHKECLQKLALSSGYFFKCPMCNNQKEFVHEMRSLGIFVPEQDASWEREPNAFEELYQQHSQCDAVDCLCPKGKSYSSQKGSWILARCRICGAAGTHKGCSNLSTVDNWACEPCLTVEINYAEKEKAEKKLRGELKTEASRKRKKPSTDTYDDTDEEVYVSARSGNRRVRNGNGRVHNRPRAKNTSNIPWKFADLTISSSCFWYFPYGKNQLAKYDKIPKASLPDWRRLQLQVNLVNLIPKSFFEQVDSANPADNDGHPSVSKDVIVKSTPVEDPVESDPEVGRKKFVKKRRVNRKRSQKKSKWGQGIVRRSKFPKRTLDDQAEDSLKKGVVRNSDERLTSIKSQNGSEIQGNENTTITRLKRTNNIAYDKVDSSNLIDKKDNSDIADNAGIVVGQEKLPSIRNLKDNTESNIEIPVDENNSKSVIKLSSFNLTEPTEKIVVGDLCRLDTDNNNDVEGRFDSKANVNPSKVNYSDDLLPLTELNMEKGVGMSPSKLSFLMSSQKGLIQEIRTTVTS